jgi:hypothetical protein
MGHTIEVGRLGIASFNIVHSKIVRKRYQELISAAFVT